MAALIEASQYSTSPYAFGSPPIPATTEQSNKVKRTRNARSSGLNGSTASLIDGSQASNSPRPKRAPKKSKSETVANSSIDLPLSQLCLDVPVVDVSEKVNRTIEERQKEAERGGKIKRPSNSFMLYRSAYGDRVKSLYPQNNHQIISRICGASWKMETQEIQDQYKQYYEMEKQNHAKAHPNYKFSPAKASPGRKRKGADDDSGEDDFASELGDYDSEYTPRGARKTRAMKIQKTDLPTSYPNSLGPYSYRQIIPGPNNGQFPSSFQATNPGKPPPIPMNMQDLNGQYLQTMIYQSQDRPDTQDILIQRPEMPQVQPLASQALIGLPGGQHDELLGVDSAGESPSPQVDPLLLTYEGDASRQAGGFGHDQDFHDFDHQGIYGNDGLPTNGHPDKGQYQPAFDPWQMHGDAEGGQGGTYATGGDFEAWWDQGQNQ